MWSLWDLVPWYVAINFDWVAKLETYCGLPDFKGWRCSNVKCQNGSITWQQFIALQPHLHIFSQHSLPLATSSFTYFMPVRVAANSKKLYLCFWASWFVCQMENYNCTPNAKPEAVILTAKHLRTFSLSPKTRCSYKKESVMDDLSRHMSNMPVLAVFKKI